MRSIIDAATHEKYGSPLPTTALFAPYAQNVSAAFKCEQSSDKALEQARKRAPIGPKFIHE